VTHWATRYNADRPRMFDQVLPTLRRMSSGSDGFFETATLNLGLRLPPGLAPMDVDAVLRALASDAELVLNEGVAAYRGDKNTPLVRAFLAAIRQVGGQPTFSVKSGTSDMNIVAPLWTTPILAYGPGDSTLDHTPNEHILLPEYQRAIEVLTRVLLTL
jgi:[amino group carrier protein]-lysine/ornithine hydrolase